MRNYRSLFFITLICTLIVHCSCNVLTSEISDSWAIEFVATSEKSQNQLADEFAERFSLVNHGRIGKLNAFSFSIGSQKRDIAQSVLNNLYQSNIFESPIHIVEELEMNYQEHLRVTNPKLKRIISDGVSNYYGIRWLEPQIGYIPDKRSTVASLVNIVDPLYSAQYHLHKITPNEMSLNVTGAWNKGINGEGVTIAIVDDGLQTDHPDLNLNYEPDGSYNFDFGRANPNPTDMRVDYHGTACAGVAGARDDGTTCGVGVAYRASLSGITILQRNPLTDVKESNALQFALHINDIYSNSWGPSDGGTTIKGPGTLAKQAIELGIQSGRSGKGAVYVWAGGNGGQNDNCNYDGYASSRYAITVGAVTKSGFKSSFSEECASLLVVGPSASSHESYIRTTDLMGSAGKTSGNCNEIFSGTSAACPGIAGVIALMLQANPELGWLDVQRILIETAYRVDPTSNTWTQNGAGYWISHYYGYGLADASKAVDLALQYKLTHEPSMNRQILLSYDSPIERPWVTLTSSRYGVIIFCTVTEDIVLQHVELFIHEFNSQNAARLSVTLTSPSGTVSVLSKSHSGVWTRHLKNWTYTTKLLWGERSVGQWKIEISDPVSEGSLLGYTLKVYGTPNSRFPNSVFKTDLSTPSYTPTPTQIPVQIPYTSPPISIPEPEGKVMPPTHPAQKIIFIILIVVIVLVVIGAAAGVFYYFKFHTPRYQVINQEEDHPITEDEFSIREEEEEMEEEEEDDDDNNDSTF